ncbi:MAG: sigma-70 family RNA polymerase sigma factor [Chitinophagaceae bacterium]
MALQPLSYQNYSDEELLPAVARGVTAAFDELYKRYGQRLFGYFFRMLWKNKELAEDQVQELFIKVIRHAGSFETGRSFPTWLYSIAHNMCKNEYRKAEVRMKHAQTKQAAGTRATAGINLDLQKFRTAVTDCIARLTEEKKSLFILRFQEQLSVPEISQVLNIPEGTIKSRLFYLLKEMKEELSEYKTLHLYP